MSLRSTTTVAQTKEQQQQQQQQEGRRRGGLRALKRGSRGRNDDNDAASTAAFAAATVYDAVLLAPPDDDNSNSKLDPPSEPGKKSSGKGGKSTPTDNDEEDPRYTFVVCHAESAFKSGQECQDEIETALDLKKSEIVAVSNAGDDGNCYFVTTTSARARRLRAPLMLQPVIPEMKISIQTMERIEGTSPDQQMQTRQHEPNDKDDNDGGYVPPSRFNALFCPGYTHAKKEDAIRLATMLMEIMRTTANAGGLRRRLMTDGVHRTSLSARFLRLEEEEQDGDEHDDEEDFPEDEYSKFLHVRRRRRLSQDRTYPTDAHPRMSHWSRALTEGLDSGLCGEMFESAKLETSHNGDVMTVDLAVDPLTGRHSFSKSCMHSLVVALAVQTPICTVQAAPEVVTMNYNAQWITQSGSVHYRPFFQPDVGLTGKGQVVAVSDTGLDTNSCFFSDSIHGDTPRGTGVYPNRRKVVQYVNFTDATDNFRGHGTHVVGTIAGRKEGSTGNPRGLANGVAPEAKIAFFDLGNAEKKLRTPADKYNLLKPGMDAGARIHSISWGTRSNYYGSEEKEIDEFMVTHDEFLVVVAGGNTGWAPNTVGAPATAKNVLTVGSSQSYGHDLMGNMKGRKFLSDFSSRGPTNDGRSKPEVVAVGDMVTSAAAGQPGGPGQCGTMKMSGTSMAAPVVAGTAAMIRQYFQQGFYPGGRKNPTQGFHPTGALLKAVLINGAVGLQGADQEGQEVALQNYDNNQNFGRILLINSVAVSGRNAFDMFAVNRQMIHNGHVHERKVTIHNHGCKKAVLSATLVWTDPPNWSSCARCVLNNLDLSVVRSNGQVIYPNGRTSPDDMNNSERVRIAAKDGEEYTIRVQATNLQYQSQHYALVVTGCFHVDSSSTSSGGASQYPGNVSPNTGPSGGSVRTRTISTVLEGPQVYYGVMFDVVAKRDIKITGMDVITYFNYQVVNHDMDLTIYTKKKTFAGSHNNPNAWGKPIVSRNRLQGQGIGKPTTVPDFPTLEVKQGERQGFYVTMPTKDLALTFAANRNLNYGDAVTSTDDVSIMVGIAVASDAEKGPFQGWFVGYIFDGSIHYELA